VAAFAHLTKFKLFHEDKEDPLTHWLGALGDPDVAFTMVHPILLGVRGEIPLSDEEIALLKNDGRGHLMVFAMLIGEGDGENWHVGVNPTSPVIINPGARRGLQLSASLSDDALVPTPEQARPPAGRAAARAAARDVLRWYWARCPVPCVRALPHVERVAAARPMDHWRRHDRGAGGSNPAAVGDPAVGDGRCTAGHVSVLGPRSGSLNRLPDCMFTVAWP
jgi:flagellar assembly factor FliW